VCKTLLDNHRVFDAGDDLDWTATFSACLNVDIAYRDVGKGREQDAVASKTRFKRCAHVIAMDAGFAGAKTGYGRPRGSGYQILWFMLHY